MNTDATAKKIQNLEILAATLTELLDVQEKVVAEQSELIEQDEASLKESNDRFLAFIKEATMRFKNPLVVIEENLGGCCLTKRVGKTSTSSPFQRSNHQITHTQFGQSLPGNPNNSPFSGYYR